MEQLLSAETIEDRVAELAAEISSDYRGKQLTILGVLTGSIVFVADLIRRIRLPHRVGVLQASSYRGETTQPGELTVNTELLPDISHRDVLLVDDIFDTGRTMQALIEDVRRRNPASIRFCTLLWKTARTQVDLAPDYCGFKIADRFVVGYGLDYNDEHRHLPNIVALTDVPE